MSTQSNLQPEKSNEQKETKHAVCLCEKERCMWAMGWMWITKSPSVKGDTPPEVTYECKQHGLIVHTLGQARAQLNVND